MRNIPKFAIIVPMANHPLKVGIVGTGSFARTHAKALASQKGVKLCGCTDPDAKKNTAFAKEFGAASFADLDALLKEGMDIVTITSPDETHASLLEQVMTHKKAPKVVIVEKPLCVSEAELKNIEALQAKYPTKIVVDHSRRFNSSFTKARDLIASGALGTELLSVHFHYYAGWFHVGVHAVDTLRMLLGDFTCSGAKVGCVDRYPEDPLLNVTLQSTSHPKAEIVLEGMCENPYKIFEGEIIFPKGRLRIIWGDVYVDLAQVDDANAPVLLPSEMLVGDDIVTTLSHLYGLTEDLIHKNDTKVLDIAGFAAARGTMDVLFEARSRAGL